ncbi:NAD-dependent dehydratase [Acidiferrobacter sp. SPIII_3]|nr:NAD-dependent dehydratase [Acidiferrobacter sp. SPIII_3]
MNGARMKVLITGGAGFIGSHLADRLVIDGHTVTLFDNLSTGKRDNLQGPASAARLVIADVRDREALMRAAHGMDALVHLAAVASVQASMHDPLATHATNFGGTLNTLLAASACQVPRVLYASSAAVYGDAAPAPVPENAPLAPLSPYAADKLAGEHYLAYFARTRGVNATSFRFFNIYGPRQDASSPYSGVISLYARCLATGAPCVVYGDGRQTRDFVYIDDLVEVLARALARDDLSCTVMNVGTGIEQDLLALINAFETLAGRPIVCDFRPARAGDVRRSLADVTRLRATFGYVPQTLLSAGLTHLLHDRAPLARCAT